MPRPGRPIRLRQHQRDGKARAEQTLERCPGESGRAREDDAQGIDDQLRSLGALKNSIAGCARRTTLFGSR